MIGHCPGINPSRGRYLGMEPVENGPAVPPEPVGSPSLSLTIEGSAFRYLHSLEGDETLYFFWGVDGLDSSSRWVAFAFPQRESEPSYRNPFVTRVCGVKVVVPEAERVSDLNGRTLTCQQGRLLVT